MKMTSASKTVIASLRQSHAHFAMLAFLLFTAFTSIAQNGSESYKPVIGPGVTASPVINGLINVNLNTFSPLSAVTDGDKSNYATNVSLLDAIGADGISVKRTTTFPAGYRAGFVVEITGGLLNASVLGALTLQTLNANTVVDTKTTGTGLSVTLLGGNNSGKLYLNFASSGTFDEVRISFANVASLGLAANSVRVYYAMAFDPNSGVNENNTICEDQLAGGGTVVNFNAGLLNVLGSLANAANLTDGNKNNAATLTLPAGTALLSTPIYVGITDLVNVFPAGNKAGFVIKANSSLLTANVLNTVKIQTYLFGDYVEEATFDDGAGLLNLAALSSSISDKKRLEFNTTAKFNEVRLVFGAGLDVAATTTDIYYAYESGASCTDCSTALSGTPVTGNISLFNPWTGSLGLCVGGGLFNAGNVVTPSTADYANISVLIGVGCGGRITVPTAATMPANTTFAGFEISNDGSGLLGLLSLAALNNITVTAYNGSTPVGSVTGASLLGGGVLSGPGGKTVVGFKPTAAFNRISITITDLIGVATNYRIYKAYVIEDTDGDGIANCQEQCGGTLASPVNDATDIDGDGIPDACDACDNSIVTPSLSAGAVLNVCPASTANLNSITATNTPSGATLSWHTGIPASSSNKVANPASVAAGIYYAAFSFSAGACYSGNGYSVNPVTASIQTCCNAGAAAPTLSANTQSNTCPTTTANLTTITASNTPASTTVTWHTGTPATNANKIADPTAVGAGTYYAAFFDAVNGCYSGTTGNGTTLVTVTITNCGGPLAAGSPPVTNASPGQAISKTASADLAPNGGATPYSYSNGTADAACIAPTGALALPAGSNLTITSATTGAHNYTAPSTPGTYYYCIKVCDATSPTPQCVVRTYTVIVTDPCGSAAQTLNKQ
jgi:hypothetical protein